MKKVNKILTLVIAVALTGITHSAFSQQSSDNTSGTYKTAIGVRGGWTSGLSVKHFVSANAALEGVLGSRWHGFNFTGLYELHSRNALNVSRLSWEYGFGGRVGFYDGRYYRAWKDKYYYEDNSYTVVSLVGIFGLEYKFGEIPFTVGFDLMPYFDFVGRGDNWIDGSLAFRYTF
jgi:hypothetical protein